MMTTLADSRGRRSSKFEKIITCSDAMLHVFDQTSRAAETDATVLITGESGTGKELIAEAIHANSPRYGKPFVVVNMAAVPHSLIESELFGHMTGAFTGAIVDRIGRVEAAHTGTLFIDEIGDLAQECQSKLLRVLENHCVAPLGSNQEKRLDVRMIAATNQSLGKMVRDGEFRAELYFRLNVVTISLPPLRERPEDIPALVDHFFRQIAATYGRSPPVVSGELMQYLQSYRWPGNIRQLRNCVESMYILNDCATLTLDQLPATLRQSNDGHDGRHVEVPDGFTLEDVERDVILQSLKRHRGNRTRAAKSLGISVRTLQRRLKSWQ